MVYGAKIPRLTLIRNHLLLRQWGMSEPKLLGVDADGVASFCVGDGVFWCPADVVVDVMALFSPERERLLVVANVAIRRFRTA